MYGSVYNTSLIGLSSPKCSRCVQLRTNLNVEQMQLNPSARDRGTEGTKLGGETEGPWGTLVTRMVSAWRQTEETEGTARKAAAGCISPHCRCWQEEKIAQVLLTSTCNTCSMLSRVHTKANSVIEVNAFHHRSSSEILTCSSSLSLL